MTSTITPSTRLRAPELRRPTLWGLDPIQLHDRFWRAQGVQVVRRGEPSPLGDAELFLLIDAPTLTVFQLGKVLSRSAWHAPGAWLIRLCDDRPRSYREVVVTDEHNRFVRLQRVYSDTQRGAARVALTHDRAVAQLWQQAPHVLTAWRQFRRLVPRQRRVTSTLHAPIYQRQAAADLMHLTRELVRTWPDPGKMLVGVRQIAPGVWCDDQAQVAPGTLLIAPVWIGARRRLPPKAVIAGPIVLWDGPSDSADAEADPPPDLLVAEDHAWQPPPKRPAPPGKRLFDIIFALAALVAALPLFPLIMLAIWLEDGRPFFFAHCRETRGGREFPCLKFRSMRRNAEAMKTALATQNRADGPQFFIENDPRLTRVGRFLRSTNLDELPQFLNVLCGHMSVVGPRPSPRKENQYCPAWREARLSVRPGIVGLWQVCRSRKPGLDFQEWIRYDIQYTERQCWRLDLWIIWRSALLVLLHRKPKDEAVAYD